MKLYARIKVNGKWTFRAACLNYIHIEDHVIDCTCLEDFCKKEMTE